jgi:hypothetical protein
LCSFQHFGRFLTGLHSTVAKDLADSIGFGGQRCAAGSGLGPELFRRVGQCFLDFAVTEAAAAVRGGHRFAVGF